MAVQVRNRLGRALIAPRRRSRMARETAAALDRVVDAELEFLRRVPVQLRARPVEALAVLVMLAQDHRHYALGWIGRRELRRRSEHALSDLGSLRDRFDVMDVPR